MHLKFSDTNNYKNSKNYPCSESIFNETKKKRRKKLNLNNCLDDTKFNEQKEGVLIDNSKY